MEETLFRTPLYDFHLRQGARMVPFAGYSMPVQYSSILEEHKAVRTAAGLFDVSHMGEILVSGPDAKRLLDLCLTNDLDRIAPGQAIYSPMCYPDGGCVDDVIVYQFAPDEFFICVNAANTAKDFEWITDQAQGMDCRVANVSADYAQIALQGPHSRDLFLAVAGFDLLTLPRFHFTKAEIFDIPVIISRTGYTGEDGLEFYIPSGDCVSFVERLNARSDSTPLPWIGLGARDSLRLEAGYPLYGHEISAELDPLTGGIGWAVKFKKAADFIGKEALLGKKSAGLTHRVRFFTLSDRRIAREGVAIYNSEQQLCGRVLSGSLSPMSQLPIGSALIATDALNQSQPLFVDIRGKCLPITLKA